MKPVLRITQKQRQLLHAHLFPGDGKEAAALAVCGRGGTRARPLLMVHRVVPIAHEECERGVDMVRWPLGKLSGLLDEITEAGMALVKFHSHPGGYPAFSSVDDGSDAAVLGAAAVWADDAKPHGSVILLPDDRMIGRVLDATGTFVPMDRITVVGDGVTFFDAQPPSTGQLFDDGTRARLESLTIGVVGLSGTGSIVVEQLLRHGVGGLVGVDADAIEVRNLDRVLNSRISDAEAKRLKTEVVARTAAEIGHTRVELFATPVQERPALEALSQCDVVFGCVDSAEGRQTLNRLAVHYLIPYFDLGVRIDADGQGGVNAVYGAVHYLRPDGSSLMERGVVTQELLRAESLKRTDPEQYADEAKRNYIRGARAKRPAVITLNMMVAARAAMELLERLHPFRLDPAADFAMVFIDVLGGGESHVPELADFRGFGDDAGRGDRLPFIGLSSLS